MEKEIDYTSPIPGRNIILIGLMGCGKSTIGKALSKMLAYPFVDTDQHIEKLEKRAISDIFKIKGEAYFRSCETQLIESLIEMDVKKHIISTGGGLPTSQQARKLLPKLGYVVWLNADVETLHERTSRTDSRPLLRTDDPKGTLMTLLDDRKDFYHECCHLVINTKGLAIDDVALGILESARFYFSERLKQESLAEKENG